MDVGETVGVPDAVAAQWAQRDARVGSAQAVHDTLRRLIVARVLEPGMPLREEDYADRFAVSRTPVREAFLRLETEQLVTRTSGRSLVVNGVTPDEILDIDAVRVAIDGLAGRLAAESARPQDVANLRWINARLRDAAPSAEPIAREALDLQFHEAVGEACRNAFLLELIAIAHDRLRRFGGSTLVDPSRAAAAADEHERLIDAIEARHPEEAERQARQHGTNAIEVRTRLLREPR